MIKDYYQKIRQAKIALRQIDYIIDNRDIPRRLLENLGIGENYGN